MPGGNQREPVEGVDFADLLRLHRRRARLTQAELAGLAGLGVRTVRDLESGRVRHPHRDTIRLLGTALGLGDEAGERLAEVARAFEPDDRLDPPASPSQLPPDVEDFVGRAAQVLALRERLQARRTTAVAIVAISGRAGIGKTALAVHLAHRLGRRFPDGRLFVSLRGAGPRARDPLEVLGGLLGAIGGADQTSCPDVDGRAERYRALLSHRRVLVVLDDAESEAQVRPLLPGSPTSAVLITSRRQLVNLDGVWRLPLVALGEDESLELLGGIVGEQRIAAEPEAAERIVRLCDHLPLAVRVAGAKLAAHPHHGLAWLAERLADERQRLDTLAHGDLEVRAGIGVGYAGLGELDRRLCRRLSLLDVPDFPAWVAAALLDAPPAVAEDALDRLCDAQLLEARREGWSGQARYRFHELIRLYAWERSLVEEAAEERIAALTRVVEEARRLGLGETADRIADALVPGRGPGAVTADGARPGPLRLVGP